MHFKMEFIRASVDRRAAMPSFAHAPSAEWQCSQKQSPQRVPMGGLQVEATVAWGMAYQGNTLRDETVTS